MNYQIVHIRGSLHQNYLRCSLKFAQALPVSVLPLVWKNRIFQHVWFLLKFPSHNDTAQCENISPRPLDQQFSTFKAHQNHLGKLKKKSIIENRFASIDREWCSGTSIVTNHCSWSTNHSEKQQAACVRLQMSTSAIQVTLSYMC